MYHRFESYLSRGYGVMVTYLIWNQTSIGSNPIVPMQKSIAQRLERLAVNQTVVGSNPTRFEVKWYSVRGSTLGSYSGRRGSNPLACNLDNPS